MLLSALSILLVVMLWMGSNQNLLIDLLTQVGCARADLFWPLPPRDPVEGSKVIDAWGFEMAYHELQDPNFICSHKNIHTG